MAMRTSHATLDGEILSVSIDGVRKDLIPDPLGSVAALVDSAGTITDTFTYWPYGEERTRTGATECATRFVGAWGYYWDNSTRIYYDPSSPDVPSFEVAHRFTPYPGSPASCRG